MTNKLFNYILAFNIYIVAFLMATKRIDTHIFKKYTMLPSINLNIDRKNTYLNLICHLFVTISMH